MHRILFVSAPFGPFFRHAAQTLTRQGHYVWRIVWEGGDFIETPLRYQVPFRRNAEDEEDFLRQALLEKHITTVITYNDAGRRNKLAAKLAKELGKRYYVLENGYLRPHWITLAQEGVNGFSKLPNDPYFYEAFPKVIKAPVTFPTQIRSHVENTVKHFAAACLLSPFLPFDSRYYGDSLWRQARHYAREYLWRIMHSEKRKISELVLRKQREQAKLFVVLTQKPGDAQLRIHSPYKGNRPFLKEVCKSFAAHAPGNAILIVKQHPYDYGVERLPRFFRNLTAELGIGEKAYYLRKTSIDVVLDNTDGLITVNSTGGLSAITRGLPVKCCGNAIFDMPGLTFQGTMDRFWQEAQPPNDQITKAFVAYLQAHSQINGGFDHPVGIDLATRALAQIITGSAPSLPPATSAAVLPSERHQLASCALPSLHT